MLHSTLWPLVGIVLFALISSCALTAVARVLARRFGFVDQPNDSHKAHECPIPLMGGLAVYGSFLLTLFVANFIGLRWLVDDPRLSAILPMLGISGSLYCLLGLWDDKRALPPRYKLLLQIVAGLPFVIGANSVDLIHLFGNEFRLGLLSIPFTLFWLVACVNIINLIDGLDGLAGAIGVVVSLTLAALAVFGEHFGAAAVALILGGCLIGFLVHNWPPAKIFLGDSGSLMIGFLIGALSIEASLKTATCFTLAVPLVLLGVPIFDTAVAIVRRHLKGAAIGAADRGHIHHCLLDRGFSRTTSLAAILALSLVMAAVALVSVFLESDLIAIGLCVFILGLLIAGRIFGYDEMMLFYRHIQAVSSLLAETSGVLRTRLLLTRLDNSDHGEPTEFWNEVCRRVQDMGGHELEFACWNKQTHEIRAKLNWQTGRDVDNEGTQWHFTYSVPRGAGMWTSLIAFGAAPDQVDRQRLDDLFHVFHTFCQYWQVRIDHKPHVDSLTVTSPVDATCSPRLPLSSVLTTHRQTANTPASNRRAA